MHYQNYEFKGDRSRALWFPNANLAQRLFEFQRDEMRRQVELFTVLGPTGKPTDLSETPMAAMPTVADLLHDDGQFTFTTWHFAEPPQIDTNSLSNLPAGTTLTGTTADNAASQDRFILNAADTFRAAATEQLEAWGERLSIPVTTAPSGTDPAAVAVKSFLAAQEAGTDLLIIDTAGRQANKRNLLQELGKIKRSLQKKSEKVPHHTWLVAEGTTGSGVLMQTKEFHEAVGLTGLIVTKLDGSARGGMVVAVRSELGIPTFFLGRGEQPADLKRFVATDFVDNFFAE